MPSEPEATPRNERVLRVVQECEQRRIDDKVEIVARVEKVEKAVEEIKDDHRSGNRRTMVAVAIIGLLGAVMTGGLGYWGQVQAIRAGASQATAGAKQSVENALPSTEATYREGFRAGARATIDEQLARLQANPQPIQRRPDSIASSKPTR